MFFLSFIHSWLIYDINFLTELFTARQFSPILDALAMLGGHFNSFMNPILFIILDPRFKAAAIRSLGLDRFAYFKSSRDSQVSASKDASSVSGTASPRASVAASGSGTNHTIVGKPGVAPSGRRESMMHHQPSSRQMEIVKTTEIGSQVA